MDQNIIVCINQYKPVTTNLASERSERDTYRGNTIENRGCLFIWRASEACETVLGVDNAKSGILCYWRASEASETLSGVTQSRFRYIYWRASVASETLTGVTQSKIGDVCLFICLDVRKAFLYFDPRVFVLVRWSTPSQTSLNRILCLSISTRITLEIELFTVLNSFAGAVKT